jgi:ElaA protein
MSERPLTWALRPFNELSVDELYTLLQLRQLAFQVEQQCAYLDADGNDAMALHLMGFDGDGSMVAYARIFAPGMVYPFAAIGRIVTHPDARGRGFGRAVTREAIARTHEAFGDGPIKISAQQRLERFYRELGFVTQGDVYEEDGIPHIAMVHSA